MKNNNFFNNILLTIGGLLVVIGLIRLDFNNLNILPVKPVNVDIMELPEPVDETLKKEAMDVASLLQTSHAKNDAKRLRDLYIDIAKLVELDGDDEVIKNTEEIRQANSLTGIMLRLDLKGKYPNLAKEAKDVIVYAIGDDQILLSKELRAKAVNGFNALAWACNLGSK